MIRLKDLINEIYLDGYSESDARGGLHIPENYDPYAEEKGWTAYRGGNDWENGVTACWVYIKLNMDEMVRVWFEVKFPKGMSPDSSEAGGEEERKKAKEWGEEASKKWLKEVKKIRKESKHKINDDDPDASWYYDDWVDCFTKSLKSSEMSKYIKDSGVDYTDWKAMKSSKQDYD